MDWSELVKGQVNKEQCREFSTGEKGNQITQYLHNGQRGLMGYNPWGRTESDRTWRLNQQ